MASQIAGQLAQWHLQGTKGIKIEQVIINTVRIDTLIVLFIHMPASLFIDVNHGAALVGMI